MGSSIVIILSSSLLILFKIEYKVVVLPEPVGPVIITMPLGWEISFLKTSIISSRMPSFSISIKFFGSKILKTMASPYSEGRVELLISIVF